ncbi:homoserine O-succinyltransferase MetA [Methylobacterium organophilum]|uniref:Homoserine O-succinyltransferase n=1 Tax=Methylobacterium organophilum TaxID=410 RepID=A0ABQ4T7S9_METOR|nr:homoserine O-succinyltransferase [Methylobacterium organophilum]GJE27732.1 Homoserine O-succinyltransferase [Methylobacterium organophilum]
MLGHGLPRPASATGEDDTGTALPRVTAEVPARPLKIGLLNNMPDAAFVQTERQFRRLIGPEASLALFAFLGPPRGDTIAAHRDAHYAAHEALPAAGLDALVITGSEPRLARLEEEPFYEPLSAVVDWAAGHTVSTLFSCLAAHAAVLHLHGIRRKPLPTKYSGVYACQTTAGHPLLAGLPETVAVPHSRWNDLDEADLIAQGYTVLRRSDTIGVDLFVRDAGSLFVFLQGHPEYDGDGLAREYRRDVGRFLDGTRESCPEQPENYFTPEAATRLEAFAKRARARRDPTLFSAFPGLAEAPPLPATWQAPAAQFFRNWLACVAARRANAATA